MNDLFRLFEISRILMKYGLDDLLLAWPIFRSFRLLIYINPFRWGASTQLPRGVRVRLALEALGPIFVKFGQNLATRPDLIPADIVQELCQLQDRVPPFSPTLARTQIEQSLGQTVEECFASFSEHPLASASISQVHAATLKSGEPVVVKVLRPGIEKQIKIDIRLLKRLASWARHYSVQVKRLRPVEVVAEFEYTLLHELDLLREGANASQLRRNFKNSAFLKVPQVYWDHTRSNVLVTERIYGVPITELERLRQENVNLKLLAQRGVELFFTQVFRDSFFHADMHAGNIFVNIQNPADPTYMVVDFGIMGSLQPRDQHYLAHNLFAFLKRDYRRVAELHVESQWVPAGTRIDLFESAIRTVCEPIFEQPLKNISFGQLLLRLFETARAFKMELLPQLILLQKTLINIEGLGRQIDPDLDIWSHAKPIIEKWMRKQMGLGSLWNNLKRQWPLILERIPEYPELIYQALTKLSEQKTDRKP